MHTQLSSRASSRTRVVLLSATAVFTLCIVAFGGTLAPNGAVFIWLFLLAFLCELVDSSFGMGYGTLLVPVLIVLGFEPREIVPTILLSELATGATASFGHHWVGNVDFRRGNRAWVIALILGGAALATAPVAALFVANIASSVLVVAIGFLILAEGFIIIALHGTIVTFSWIRIALLGAFASFVKALCGGGYGPLVTGGQVLIGVDERNAVAITSLAETLTCFVALAVFLLSGGILDQVLLWPLLLGALSSIPMSLSVVKVMRVKTFRALIGIVTALIGLFIILTA